MCLFRSTPVAYSGSQARGQIRAVTAGLHHSHSNTGSFTHWAGPEIEPASSWILVRFVITKPQWELHVSCIWISFFCFPFLSHASLAPINLFQCMCTCARIHKDYNYHEHIKWKDWILSTIFVLILCTLEHMLLILFFPWHILFLC